jgi:type IV secretory pathway TraG/TraD family ATPase VirD4
MSWNSFSRRKIEPAAKPPPEIRFGLLDLPENEAPSHFLSLAATGGGKSIIQRLIQQSVLPTIGSGVDKRALVYDAKQDALPLLKAIAPKADIVTLNPFDVRGVSWDLQRDIQEPRIAVELAFTFVPREHESQPFFSDAARHLLYGVLLGFLLRGCDWSLADIIRALSNPKRLKRFLKQHPATRAIVPRYFHDERLLSNIFSTIATKLLTLECIAAAWETADRKIALADWVTSETILILGNSETSRAAIDALNRAIFQRVTQYVLAQTESFTRRTWFFIDELSEAGKLDGLVSLLKKGRSKGACVSICSQSLSGLRDERLYGIHGTEDLMAQIGNRFYGRVECPESAETMSRVFGDQEVDQYTTSHTWGKDSSTTRSQQIVVRRAVLPSEFLNIEPCTRENGLTAYYRTRTHGCIHGNVPGDELFEGLLIPPAPDVPEFIPRPPLAQLLSPWTAEQLKRFGLERKPRRVREKALDLASSQEVSSMPEQIGQDATTTSIDSPKPRPNLLHLEGIDDLLK